MSAQIKQYTAQEVADSFAHMTTANDTDIAIEQRSKELEKLTKAELIAEVLKHETKRSGRGLTVQELAKAMLKSEDHLGVNYQTIADAIRIIMPEANTSAKSIASYVSKKGEEWELPARYLVRSTKAKEAQE